MSSQHHTEELLFHVLIQLIVIMLAARAGGQLARRMGQPRVVGEIIAGLMLGPSLFGKLCPELFHGLFESIPSDSINVLSQIGLVFLMFQIGLDFDFSHLREKQNRNIVIAVATVGILIPFGLGILLGQFSAPHLAPDTNRLGYTLFMATSLSITAIPVLGRIMTELGMARTRLGAIAITAAAINDVVGWILLALVTALAAASFTGSGFCSQLGLLALYFAVCLLIVKPFLRWLLHYFKVDSKSMSQNFQAVILSIVFLSAIATFKLGIFAIFGGFSMGVLLYDQSAFVETWKAKMNDFVTVFFLPIFFTYTGLRTNIGGLDSSMLWGWCVGIIAVATCGKFFGSYFAARSTGLNSTESSCIGIMMNTRGLMELIVLNVGLELKLIPPTVFTILVLMAVVSNVMTSPLLRLWLPKLGHIIPKTSDV